MDNSKNKQSDHLGINKIGKNIRKSPLHQPNFPNTSGNNGNSISTTINSTRQQPQPHVYNISKNDFRSIVQQLTGSPSHDSSTRPPLNPPKSQSLRLQKIRPPPLAPMNRPHIPAQVQPITAIPPPASRPHNNNHVRPVPFVQPPPPFAPSTMPGDSSWPNTAESPISAYMRFLQSSITDAGAGGDQAPPCGLHPTLPQPQALGFFQPQQPGMVLHPAAPAMPSAPVNGHHTLQPVLNASQMNGLPLLPSPTSQFVLPSPTGFMSLLSPRSPYPLLSPGIQFPPLTPNFTFSPFGQSGIPGPGSQPPPSPGLLFPLSPLSPSGFFSFSSPRWREP